MRRVKMTWLLAMALCLLGGWGTLVTGDVESDLTALRVTVEQQGSAIQSLQSSQTALSSQLAVLNRQVAFSAHMSRTHVYVGNIPFVFDVIVTNLGQGYNATDGVFKAPQSGLYVFHFVIVNDVSSPFIRPALMKNGWQVLAVGTVDGGPDSSFDDGSVMVTVHLLQEDKITVQRRTGAFTVYGDEICSFSGFLVSSDSE